MLIRKLKAGARSCANHIEALGIKAFSRYGRGDIPEFDDAFASRVRSDESFFSVQLSTNRVAVTQADSLVRRRFRVLSMTADAGGDGLDWHKDFATGATFPVVPYPRIRIEHGRGRDVVVPWEFSRLQFIPTLIQAHRAFGDSRYVDCFRSIVDDWIDNNPYLVGVNWWTGMEVAIRGINLLLGLIYFAGHLDAATETRYRGVLWAHARAIHRHDFREIRSHRNNHFLISAVGLLAISLSFRGEVARSYSETARRHLETEIPRQFRQDGGNFESAIHYHQLSLEAALVALGFLAAARETGARPDTGLTLGEVVHDRLAKATRLVSDYTRAFGRSPQFGDSSDGRIVVFRDYFGWDPRDHTFIEELARLALGEQVSFSTAIQSAVYTDSGYGFFGSDTYGVCLCASPVAEAGHGGHNHCDKTSVVVQIGGQPVFVDAGTCSYSDLAARYRHKRTRAHNVVGVDEREQGDISETQVFGRPGRIETRIDYTGDRDAPAWTLSHDGYSRFDELKTVRRTVRCREREIEVEESIDGHGAHLVEIFWNLDPAVAAELEGREIRFRCRGDVVCRMSVPDGFEATVEKGAYSPGYGVCVGNARVVLGRRAIFPLSARYEIVVETN